jgi:hypothetical protein
VAHDARRHEDLVTAVAALDAHVQALAEASVTAPVVMPELPPLPDMAEPPQGLLDLVATMPVHAVPHGSPSEWPGQRAVEAEQAEEAAQGSEPPGRPSNGLRSDPRDLAEADAFNAQTPAWLERVVGGGPIEPAVTRDAADVSPTGTGATDPATSGGPAASGEPSDPGERVEPDRDGAGEVGGEGVGDGGGVIEGVVVEGVMAAAAGAPVEGVGSPGPADRQAVVDDVIWRAMVRIDACRSDGPAGFLPVVFDDPFPDLDADEVVEVLSRLSRLTDLVQFVIVSDRPEIAGWAHDLGPEHALVVG